MFESEYKIKNFYTAFELDPVIHVLFLSRLSFMVQMPGEGSILIPKQQENSTKAFPLEIGTRPFQPIYQSETIAREASSNSLHAKKKRRRKRLIPKEVFLCFTMTQQFTQERNSD